jgi:hypothetical protein
MNSQAACKGGGNSNRTDYKSGSECNLGQTFDVRQTIPVWHKSFPSDMNTFCLFKHAHQPMSTIIVYGWTKNVYSNLKQGLTWTPIKSGQRVRC